MTKEAMTLALEALKYPLNTSHEGFNVDMAELLAHRAIKALEEALAKQEQGEPDWKDQYEKQKRRAEMWIAKYEKDIGPLEYAVPAKQEQGEPVGYQQLFDAIAAATNTPYEGAVGISVSSFEKAIGSKIYTTPQQRKPLTDGLPCCGYTDATAIKWNEFNHAVQCHNCGHTYTQTSNNPLTLDYIDQHIGADEGDREAVVALVREVEAAHGIKE